MHGVSPRGTSDGGNLWHGLSGYLARGLAEGCRYAAHPPCVDKCNAKAVSWLLAAASDKLGNIGLTAPGFVSELRLGYACLQYLRDEPAPSINHNFFPDMCGYFSSPIANIRARKSIKPLIFISSDRGLDASLYQAGLGANNWSQALDNEVFYKLNTEARNTILVLGNASHWIDAAAHLDMAIGEVADVKVGHLGHLFRCDEVQKRPSIGVRPFGIDLALPRQIWTEHFTGELAACGALNGWAMLHGDGFPAMHSRNGQVRHAGYGCRSAEVLN